MSILVALRRLRWGVVAVALIAIISVAAIPRLSAVASSPSNDSGVLCTTSPSPNPTFSLTATSGFVSMADGNTSFMWGYTLGNNPYQAPGPTLCVNQGDTVTIALKNTLPEDVSIVFPGQENVLANNMPAEPQFDLKSNLLSLTTTAPKSGGNVTYSFVATQPGTYIYESGTDPGKQVQMGLFGTLIVRPNSQAGRAYNEPNTAFNQTTEYVMLFSEVDPFLHAAVHAGLPYDVTALHSRYWMINGRTFPDTISANFSSTLPSQPQGALVHIHPFDPVSNPLPALVRYLNVGDHHYPFHPHGMHGRVIGRDGRVLEGATGQDLSYEKFTVLVGTGQTLEATYNWTDVEQWNPTTNPIPVPLPQQQNLTYKNNATWFSGSPYLGYQAPLPVGVTEYNQCGEYYQAWHNHQLYQAANYEAGFGGQFTLERIDPPMPNTCP